MRRTPLHSSRARVVTRTDGGVSSWLLSAALVLSMLVAAVSAPLVASAQETPPLPAEEAEAATPASDAPLTVDALFAGESAGMTVVSQELTPAGAQATARFSAVQDSYISSALPNVNFGGSNTLFLGWNQANQQAMRILLQFDLGAIPRNARIIDATYNINQRNVSPAGDGNMTFLAQFMRDSWSENSVTWNNANYLGAASLPFGEVDSSLGWKRGPALEPVRAWVSGSEPNRGLLITGDETPSRNRFRQFSSREDAGFVPFLEVTWELSCDQTPPTATVEPLPAFSADTFTVRWSGFDSAPSGCAPSGLANFDVEYSINGSSWVRWQRNTTATSAQFNSAGNGQFVQFRARATDNAGNRQPFSGAQTATTVDALPPFAVVNPLPPVTVEPSFLVSWTGSDNLSGIARYDLQVRRAGEQWVTALEGTTATSDVATGAVDGVTYEFRVRAIDTVGNVQPWPDGAQASTTVRLYAVATMQAFTPPIIGPATPPPTEFTVRWTSIAPPGTSVQSVTIFFRPPSGGGWRNWATFPGTQASAQFPLAALGFGDGIYEFEAIATNNAGRVEPRSNEAEARVTVDLAGAIQVREYLPLLFHRPLQ